MILKRSSIKHEAPILLQGLQGWTSKELNNHFYPPKTSVSADKLTFYSRGGGFGCVEVDSSNYSIPHTENVLKWVRATPEEFTFHFKAYGPLCRNVSETSMLPNAIKNKLSSAQRNKDKFVITELESDIQDDIWRMYNAALQPVHSAGKLGVVLFQFNLGFTPSRVSYDYLRHCARKLDGNYHMAVEFRNRDWIANDGVLQELLQFLRGLRPDGCCLAAADDLVNELYLNRPSITSHIQANQSERTYLTSAGCPLMLYIRIHRRVGNMRVLRDEEVELWRKRILAAVGNSPTFRGCIYILWGTDYADQSIQNAKKMSKALPEFYFDWKHHVTPTGKGSIAALISSTPKKELIMTTSQITPGSDANIDNNATNFAPNKRLIEHIHEMSNDKYVVASAAAATVDDDNCNRNSNRSHHQDIRSEEPKSWEEFANEFVNLSQKRLRYGKC